MVNNAAAVEREEPEEIEREDAPEPSLRETLEAARDEVLQRQEGAPAEEEQQSQRERDERGRFLRSIGAPEKEIPAASATTAQSSATAAQPAAETGAAAATAATDQAPQAWNAQEKALWAQIPPAARAAIARREQEVHRTITTHDQVRRVGNDFVKVANEFGQLIQARGGNPIALAREMFQILNNLHAANPQQRAALLRDIAQRQGADLSAFGQQPAGQAGAPATGQPSPQQIQLPPAIQNVVNEWQQFKNERQQFAQRQAAEMQARQQAEMTQATAELESFRSNAAHSHFDQVSGLMTSLLNDGHAQTLEEAYSLAVRAHPEVSKLVEAEAKAKAEAADRQRQLAEKARRKSGGVRGGPGRAPESAAGSRGSVRDDIRAAIEESRSRV